MSEQCGRCKSWTAWQRPSADYKGDLSGFGTCGTEQQPWRLVGQSDACHFSPVRFEQREGLF